MYKISLVVSLGIITLLMGGCSGSKESGETESTPQPTESSPAPSPANSSNQSLQQPTPSETGNQSPEVYGLIPSTNPDQRRTTIIQGRQDPFALIPVQPSVNVKPAPPQPPTASTTSRKSLPPGSTTSTTSTTSTNPASGIKSPTSGVPPLPPKIPQPELAQAVQITGVIKVGGATKIIVKAPDEQFSRYVEPGQYLSNGQVLVKRIEMNQGSTPVVVLEELGMEVYKEVGQASAQAPTQAS